jgi:hypothetical protein
MFVSYLDVLNFDNCMYFFVYLCFCNYCLCTLVFRSSICGMFLREASEVRDAGCLIDLRFLRFYFHVSMEDHLGRSL